MGLAREQRTRRNIYGRRLGRPLSRRQQDLLDNELQHYAVLLPTAPQADTLDKSISLDNLFKAKASPLWLEIRFGAGEHLAAQARAHPEVCFIGCEPFINGLAKMLRRVVDEGLQNVRLFADDAALLMEALPDQSLDRIFVLFPDPWPKSRHKKRRVVSTANLASLARLARDGAELRVATDVPSYCRWTLAQMAQNADFEWMAEEADDWRHPPADWPETRFQKKAVQQGRNPVFLRFRRRPRCGANPKKP